MRSRADFIKTVLVLIAISAPSLAVSRNKTISNIPNRSGIDFQQNYFEQQKIGDQFLDQLIKEGAISEAEYEYLSKTSDSRDELIINSGNKLTKKDNLNELEVSFKNKNNNLDLYIDNLSSPDLVNIKNIKNGWRVEISYSENNLIKNENKSYKFDYYGIINFVNDSTNNILMIDFIPENLEKNIKPIVSIQDNKIKIEIKNLKQSTKYNISSRQKNKFKRFRSKRAIAPPLGDIATGSLVVENRAFIKLDGPKVSMTLQNAPAKDALMQLSKLGKYGFVYLNDDTNKINNRNTASNEDRSQGPRVTLSFSEEDFSIAFNSILLASGLQAKKEADLIMVGENVLSKSFGPQLSKVYRLNQASSSSAADYLASLGATINKVNVVTASTTGSSGSGSSNINRELSITNIDSYSASNGPLKGLIGTTDSRLQSITLIGDEKLINIAEKYLKQLDLRQRQVALSVKILDVELVDNDNFGNDIALRTGSAFIISKEGQLLSTYGKFVPEFSFSPYVTTTNLSNKDGKAGSEITEQIVNQTLPNPGFKYNDNEIYNYLSARIQATSTKVLASPTLLLSESKEKLEGGQEQIAKIGGGSAFIGRPYANESFVTVGTRVITDLEAVPGVDGAPTKCTPTFSIAGLEFGAKVHKIDDNGYVTFTLSPKLTSVSETSTIRECGTLNILSVRKLDTGTLRVRDSQTLILTGVISDLDNENISKVPLLGDIPIIGNLFKKSSKSKRKSELIIMVTPTIIDDSDIGLYNSGYIPKTSQSKQIINEGSN